MPASPAPAVTECLHALCSFTKVGTMVFLLHDINDGFLESAKMANYADKLFLGNCLFVLFIISWVATRLTYFPLWVIRSCLSEPLEVTPVQPLPLATGLLAVWTGQAGIASLSKSFCCLVSQTCSFWKGPHILKGTKACCWQICFPDIAFLQEPDNACDAPPWHS